MGRRRINITEEQREWLRKNYATTSNKICSEYLGVSIGKMYHWTTEMGLRKPMEYRQAVMRDLLDNTDLREKLSKGIRAAWKRDQIRVSWGLKPLTLLHVTPMPVKLRNRIYRARYELKELGYILEEKDGRRTAYYLKTTHRKPIKEANLAAARLFTFAPYPELENTQVTTEQAI